MNQNEVKSAGSSTAHYQWWAAASTGQLVWGIYAFRRGYAGECRMMPLKAFGVASLFVGAIASASVASLRASGIHSEERERLNGGSPFGRRSRRRLGRVQLKVEDMKAVGASIRTGLGLTRRARDD